MKYNLDLNTVKLNSELTLYQSVISRYKLSDVVMLVHVGTVAC